MTDDELDEWAANNPTSMLGIGIRRLLREAAALRTQIEDHCDRIAAQSALLSRKAEVVTAEEAAQAGITWNDIKGVKLGAFDGSTWDGVSERSGTMSNESQAGRDGSKK